MSQRIDRVDELLREEIGRALAKDVQDPRIGFATVTDVETSPDLRHARVWVSVIGDRAQRDATVAALERALGYVRRELGTKLRLKRIPQFHVRLDDSIERGSRVLRLLTELEAGRTPAVDPADGPAGDSLPTPRPRLPHEGDAAEPEALEGATPTEPERAARRRGRRTAAPAGRHRRRDRR